MSSFSTAETDKNKGAASKNDGDQIRVMIVDDGLVIRGMLTRILQAEGDIQVVASVADGERALAALKRTPVDVVVLDIEMPVMDGMTALPKIVAEYPNVKVIMASTLTERNAEISMQALQKGAADYIPKPGSTGAMSSADEFKRELVGKVRALGKAKASAAHPRVQPRAPAAAAPKSAMPRQTDAIELRPGKAFRPDVVAIGSSTGGPQALVKVLGALGAIPQPILITQHMPPTFTRILAEHITRAGKMPCHEGEDGAVVEPGQIYLAPGDRHMLVKGQGSSRKIKLDDGPAENFCRPAVDPMLRSIVQAYGSRILTVILTGMGSDGAKGCKAVVDAGGQVLAQDEATSVVWGMPGAAAKMGLCTAILPLEKIGNSIRDYATMPASMGRRA